MNMTPIVRFTGDNDQRTKFGKAAEASSPYMERLKTQYRIFVAPDNHTDLGRYRELVAEYPKQVKETQGYLTPARTTFIYENPAFGPYAWGGDPGEDRCLRVEGLFRAAHETQSPEEFYDKAAQMELATIEGALLRLRREQEHLEQLRKMCLDAGVIGSAAVDKLAGS